VFYIKSNILYLLYIKGKEEGIMEDEKKVTPEVNSEKTRKMSRRK